MLLLEKLQSPCCNNYIISYFSYYGEIPRGDVSLESRGEKEASEPPASRRRRRGGLNRTPFGRHPVELNH